MSVLHQRLLFVVGYVSFGVAFAFTLRTSGSYQRKIGELRAELEEESLRRAEQIGFVFNAGMWPFLLLWGIWGYVRFFARYVASTLEETRGIQRFPSDKIRYVALKTLLVLAHAAGICSCHPERVPRWLRRTRLGRVLLLRHVDPYRLALLVYYRRFEVEWSRAAGLDRHPALRRIRGSISLVRLWWWRIRDEHMAPPDDATRWCSYCGTRTRGVDLGGQIVCDRIRCIDLAFPPFEQKDETDPASAS